MSARRLLFIVATVVLVVGGLELLLRVAERIFPGTGKLEPIVADPEIGRVGNPRLPDHDVDGFRNASRPDHVDVLAIGDSQTYGIGVSRAHAWPHVLAKLTGQSVYSAAFGGYGPGQYAVLAARKVALHPELVVVGLYIGNDLSEAYGWRRPSNTPEHEALHDSWKRMRARIAEVEPGWWQERAGRDWHMPRSRLKALLRDPRPGLVDDRPEFPDDLIWAVVTGSDPDLLFRVEHGAFATVLSPLVRLDAINLEDPLIEEGLRFTLLQLTRIRDTFAGSADLLVLLIPTKETVVAAVHGPWPDAPPSLERLLVQEREAWLQLKAGLDAENIVWVDALPALEQSLRAGTSPFFRDWDSHFVAAGQALLAEVVAQAIMGKN